MQDFFNQSNFSKQGAVITDLDSTIIHDFEGRYGIPQSIVLSLKKIYDLGRRIVLSTLRFPLSVMRTFGKEWYDISNAPIPTVLLNGSLIGNIQQATEDSFEYEEIAAFPLTPVEIDEMFLVLKQILSYGIDDLLVFYYSRDWGAPVKRYGNQRLEELNKRRTKNKYLSASAVISGNINALQSQVRSQDICMIFILIDVPEDRLMAYQHAKKSNFFTHGGVDKLFGSEKIASMLGFQLRNSLGGW